MRGLTSKNLLGILVVGVLIILGVSANAQAQGRGRNISHMDKKCEKFVNCHDARDGRWDGRGPRRDVNWTNNGSWRHRRHSDWDRRNRNWDDLNHRRRHHDRNRDWDTNRNWRHRN